MYTRASVVQLPALRCNRKCIQNDLNVHRHALQCLNRIFSIPVLRRASKSFCMHFQLQCNAGNRATFARAYIVNPP